MPEHTASIRKGTARAFVARAVLFCGLLLAAAPAVAKSPVDLWRAYVQLVYDYEVAGQCGLIGPRLTAAFLERRVTGGFGTGLGAGGLKRLRLAAIVAADREYDNRGLGGYRPWCLGEGVAGVRRILRIPR